MRKERNAVDTRQGEPDRRVFRVLVISTLTAAVLALGAYLYVFSQDDEDIAERPVRIITPDGG